jgi:glucosamine-phosphate N-acetyltransferase
MRENYKIEPLRRDHMEDVVTLLQYLSEFQPPHFLYDEIWHSFSSQSHVFSIVITENKTVIGYGSIVIETKVRGGKMGHIEDIVTSPTHRNSGVGRLLIDALSGIAKQHGCYKVALQCQENNVVFYEKCNFAVSGLAMQQFLVDKPEVSTSLDARPDKRNEIEPTADEIDSLK